MAEIIGRSGGKPGKQGKNKWAEPAKAEEKPAIVVAPVSEQKAEESSAAASKPDKAKEKKAQAKKVQQDAMALLEGCKKSSKKGSHKSIYLSHDNMVFLDMLKTKKGLQYASVVNTLIDEFRKKYDGFDMSGEAEDDE